MFATGQQRRLPALLQAPGDSGEGIALVNVKPTGSFDGGEQFAFGRCFGEVVRLQQSAKSAGRSTQFRVALSW